MTGFEDARYVEVYVSVKVPIPEGTTYKEMERIAERTACDMEAIVGERHPLEDAYWVYRDKDGAIVDEPLER